MSGSSARHALVEDDDVLAGELSRNASSCSCTQLAELGVLVSDVGARSRSTGSMLHARDRPAFGVADRRVERRFAAREAPVHLDHVLLLDVEAPAISACVGSMPMAESFAFSLLRLKKSLRWACVVPIFTSRQLLRMNRRM